MSSLKLAILCIALFISPFYTNSFPDAPPGYVTKECWDRARTFKISEGMKIPLAYDSAQICMYQNLQVLNVMRSLQLTLTTPHTGRSICRMEVHWFNETAGRVNMTIYDTDLKGNCTPRNGTVIVKARQDWRTKQISELEIPRTIVLGRAIPWTLRKYARLLFTEYKTCLILITSFDGDKYCELFVVRNATIDMHDTPCHSIYRIYCGYGRPTRGVWPIPVLSSSDDIFLQEAHQLRLLIGRIDPLKEDTIFMNEFQTISEVLYHIPEANVYASTPEDAKSKRLCGIKTYKVFPDSAELALRMIISGKNQTIYRVFNYQWDMNAISPTKISLPDQYGLMRVLLSDFKNCYVLKKVNSNKHDAPFCELFVKNNTNPITHLDECWFVFLAFCGYPKAIYNETSCYSNYR